jgi:hypothetical protein
MFGLVVLSTCSSTSALFSDVIVNLLA